MTKTPFAVLASALTLAAVFASASASAQDLKMSTYLGAAAGAAYWNVDCAGSTSCTKNPTSGRIFGGYNITPNVAVELTYASLGTIKASNAVSSLNVKGSSFDISAVYKFSGSSTGLGGFVKGGLAYQRTKADATLVSAGVTSSGSLSKNSYGLLVGAGLTYQFSDNFGLRAEVDTQRVDVSGGGKGNVTSLAFGGQASF